MCKRTIVAIGGGEIKNKSTLEIDRYIAGLAAKRAGDKRPCALSIGTASHDFMPYFNSFRKTYTSVFGIKVDVALTVYHKTDPERLKEKFMSADMIYVGGGDTAFMINSWRQTGILALVRDAYDRGVIVSGLSAGAVCWFEEMYTDSEAEGKGDEYSVMPALGYIKGMACPHFNEREKNFLCDIAGRDVNALCIEDNCAVVFENEVLARVVSAGGSAWSLVCRNGKTTKQKII